MGRYSRCLRLSALVVAAAFLWLARGARAENLVSNGDFELPSPESPPPGWVMWGPEEYKVPANYTRDTTNPRQGAACLRIQHPAGTEGYIVSSPESAVRPRKGMMYAISFWARTDSPGVSQFGFTAYESIAPYVDAASPGWWSIEVGTDWKQFRFEVHEGWDFFSDRSRFLLLTFRATTRRDEEKMLWVDDVEVTEQMSDREGRLVDEATLGVRLEHRLQPGEQLEFSVDAAKRLRRATRDAGGVSFHRVAGWTGQPYDRDGRYTLAPQIEEAIRQMRLPTTRFYAVGEEPFGLEASIDRAAEVCRRVGVPLDHTVLEFESQGAEGAIPPEVWARGAQHSLNQGYGFRHWEVANEPYGVLWGAKTAFPMPDDYVNHFKAVSAAVRKVHPEGHVGIAVDPRDARWGNYVLKQAASSYDFVVGHYYVFPQAHRARLEDIALSENLVVLDRILRTNALIRAYNPGRDIYQYDTEWGLHSFGPNNERADNVDRNANIFGTLHRAVRLIYYVREGMLRGACGWQMLSHPSGQGFGILSQDAPDKQYMLYWLYYYFNRHVGEWVLDVQGSAPYYTATPGTYPEGIAGPITPAVATVSEDGATVYLIIANGSWERAVPCRTTFRSFEPATAAAVLLSHSDPDGKPLLERKEDAVSELPVTLAGSLLTCTIPPHSVVFVRVSRQP